MNARLQPRHILCGMLAASTLLCAGCSALIAYTGQDVERLKNKKLVQESFGNACNRGQERGVEFEEYHTRRKISEPSVAGVCLVFSASSLGLFELWMFPVAIVNTTWTTVVGQTLRFDYAENGDVKDVRINGTSMRSRARLP